jgi:hypothetical protein
MARFGGKPKTYFGGRTADEAFDNMLSALNGAIKVTADLGPDHAMLFLAEYLNNIDGVEPKIAESLPDDWLSRWSVTAAGPEVPQLKRGIAT